jgi:hydroxyacylglutathione hydrolase
MQSAFVGDVIFLQGIGRTDLDGGDFNQLIHSIQTQVFTLPDQTILYPGHGPATTVKDEKLNNPYF